MEGSLMFILFFGTRPGREQVSGLPGVACPYCGQRDQLQARIQNQYIHLFWIPVYRLSPSVLIECSHCKKAYGAGEFTPEMKEALQDLDGV
jgi:DNA-directed RNA polymerase subunit RPC12/RpoP